MSLFVCECLYILSITVPDLFHMSSDSCSVVLTVGTVRTLNMQHANGSNKKTLVHCGANKALVHSFL